MNTSITLSGNITEIKNCSSRYGVVGDNINIMIGYDPQNMKVDSLLLILQTWGEMHPLNTADGYFHSPYDWQFSNTETLWQMKGCTLMIRTGTNCMIIGKIE